MNTRTVLEKYIACMQSGDNVALADLFDKHGVLHDSSLIKIGRDTMHLEGKMAIEMMFHNKFGFNRGAFPISAVKYRSIIVLPADAVPGTPAKDYFNIKSEYVLEVDITPNRADACSQIGRAHV